MLIPINITFWGWVFSDYWGFKEESSGRLGAEKVYPNQSLPMTKTEAVVENGLVKIALEFRIRRNRLE